MAQIPPEYVDAVVALGTRNDEGGVAWVASGFFFAAHEEGTTYRTYLVTNKHVIADETSLVMRINPQAALPAKEFDIDVVDAQGNAVWIGHPDPDVDVAVTGVSNEFFTAQALRVHYFTDDQTAQSVAQMTQSGVSEGDDLFVLGFPMQLVGGPRNSVIVRRGCFARFQDLVAGASKSFLIDAYIFPGNSGGPVINRLSPVGIDGTTNPTHSVLIGIIAEAVQYVDTAYSLQTRRARVSFEENAGLGVVFPVDSISDTVTLHRQTYPLEAPTPTEAVAVGDEEAEGLPLT